MYQLKKMLKKIPLEKSDDILNKYIVPCIFLAILVLIVGWITYMRVKIQVNVGPGWDTFDFLANAAYFAGQGFGYTEFLRPPFLSILTAILFKLGYTSESTIFYVDGALFIFGVIGLYLFLKLRFSSLLSFLGSLLFATFPIILLWVTIGYSDIASVSFSIWALYLTVLAVKKDSKFFYLSFPIATIAFLTRYPAGFILLPMIFYLLANIKLIKNFKDIIIGLLASFLVIIPALIFFMEKFNNPFFPFLGSLEVTTNAASTDHFAYIPDPLYFLKHMASYISLKGIFHLELFYILISILLIGIFIYCYKIIKFKLSKLEFKNVYNILMTKPRNKKLELSLIIILALIFILTFSKTSYIISEIIFFSLSYMVYTILKDIKNMDLDLMFLLWFMVYFTIHSVFAIKVDRYFILMAPAFTYFVILGLNEISSKLKFTVKNVNLVPIILSLIIIIMVLVPTISWIEHNYSSVNNHRSYYEEVGDSIAASQWLINYDPDYKTKKIYSDYLWPHFSWYLKMGVSSTLKLNYELDRYDADYYLLSNSKLESSSYKKINHFGNITIYKRN